MLGRRHINNLPGEVLDYIFSFLDFESLRMAAQACLHWRDHGIDHPTFWRNVKATSATAGALDMLAARLGQSCGRPFSLTIDIEAPLRPAAEKRLMNLITAIMPTVQQLHIRLNSFCLVTLWSVLNLHPPELTSFSLKLYNPDRVMARDPLNAWIFNNLPGKLREVTIEDVTIPSEHLYFPAFSNLHTLQMFHPSGSHSPFPVFIFENCRHLHTLLLQCGIFTYEDPWTAAALEGLSQLTVLDVHLDPLARNEFVAQMPLLNDIPVVILTMPPDEDAVYDFLAGVGSPFNVGLITLDANDFFVLIEDDRTGYMRKMVVSKKAYARAPDSNGQIHPLFENDEFPAQVQFLKVSLSIWNLLVPYMTLYTSLPKLMVDLSVPNGALVEGLDGTPLAFCALDTFVLENNEPGCAFVMVDDIISFVDSVLQAPQCRRLEVHRVFPRGDLAALHRRFDHVTYSPVIHGRPIIRRRTR
ncbi:hypothetical protein AURDEDRAFT_171842 [Auricularia subglabra TFB-10046 SS5]|uniref:F-box domain-containing protein n=1 Tax=Auricularia subglabra (strain TFB-10046 / SS5) TaxID=717982 RepID=J0LIJ5_AURST|nr:hypothetical protein AURDEDRAFT_171842 [Auricularia subglabra TFB-10046 SS5]